MALLLLLVTLTVCAALPQDMSGKVFTFPQESETANVRLTTLVQSLSAVTVCLRTFTDLDRNYASFSLATPIFFNGLLFLKNAESDEFTMYIMNNKTNFRGLDFKPNTWHSLCSTWDSDSGLVQVWLDGKPSSRKYISSGSGITGPIIIILGQDQDEHGEGFDTSQSFVGMMSDISMWNYTLPPCKIQDYMFNSSFTSGNALDWRALSFQTFGKVLVEDKQSGCQSSYSFPTAYPESENSTPVGTTPSPSTVT